MSKQFYDFLMLSTTIISGVVLAFSKQLAERTPKLRWLEKLRFRIPTALFLILITYYSSCQKELISTRTNKVEQNRRDSLAKIELDKRDLILKERDLRHERREDSLTTVYSQRVDSSYNKSIKSSNEALGKYSLRLVDSLHHVATRINSKAVVPQLSLKASDLYEGSPLYMTRDSNTGSWLLAIRMISSSNTSYKLYVDCYIVKPLITGFWILQSQKILRDDFLTPERYRTIKIGLNQKVLNEETLEVIFIGKFSKDQDSKEFILYREARTMNFKTNTMIGNSPIDISAFEKYVRSHDLEPK